MTVRTSRVVQRMIGPPVSVLVMSSVIENDSDGLHREIRYEETMPLLIEIAEYGPGVHWSSEPYI